MFASLNYTQNNLSANKTYYPKASNSLILGLFFNELFSCNPKSAKKERSKSYKKEDTFKYFLADFIRNCQNLL